MNAKTKMCCVNTKIKVWLCEIKNSIICGWLTNKTQKYGCVNTKNFKSFVG